jgi:hypothetical protein
MSKRSIRVADETDNVEKDSPYESLRDDVDSSIVIVLLQYVPALVILGLKATQMDPRAITTSAVDITSD